MANGRIEGRTKLALPKRRGEKVTVVAAPRPTTTRTTKI